MYKIGEFAEKIGRSINTLRKWDASGKLVPHKAPSGHRFYTEQQYREYIGLCAPAGGRSIAYCRVSSHGQKKDLLSQKEFVSDFCRNSGISIDEWITDIGSGLNYKRKGFNSLLSGIMDGKVSKLIIAHPDRLVRFGFEWIASVCRRFGCEVVIINDERLSPQEEVVKDLLTIIHVFSSRVYGLRKYKTNIKKEL